MTIRLVLLAKELLNVLGVVRLILGFQILAIHTELA